MRPNIDHHLPAGGKARLEGPGEGMYITALRALMYAENEREKFSGYAENFFTHVHFRSSPIENFISPHLHQLHGSATGTPLIAARTCSCTAPLVPDYPRSLHLHPTRLQSKPNLSWHFVVDVPIYPGWWPFYGQKVSSKYEAIEVSNLLHSQSETGRRPRGCHHTTLLPRP